MTMIAFEAHQILKEIEDRISYHEHKRQEWYEAARKVSLSSLNDTYEHARMVEHIHAVNELYSLRAVVTRTISDAQFQVKFETQGYKDGRAAGSLVFMEGYDRAQGEKILQGINDGDPAILENLPSPDFSGEWADSQSWESKFCEIAEIDMQDIPEDTTDEYTAYEIAFNRGVVDEIVSTINYNR